MPNISTASTLSSGTLRICESAISTVNEMKADIILGCAKPNPQIKFQEPWYRYRYSKEQIPNLPIFSVTLDLEKLFMGGKKTNWSDGMQYISLSRCRWSEPYSEYRKIFNFNRYRYPQFIFYEEKISISHIVKLIIKKSYTAIFQTHAGFQLKWVPILFRFCRHQKNLTFTFLHYLHLILKCLLLFCDFFMTFYLRKRCKCTVKKYSNKLEKF